MASRPPFLPLYGDDFMSGCRKAGMTPAQVGCYIFLLLLEWADQKPLEDDMRKLSMRMGWDVRTVRTLVTQVVATGRYRKQDGALSNERLETEIAIYCDRLKTRRAARQEAANGRGSQPKRSSIGTDTAPNQARNGAQSTEIDGSIAAIFPKNAAISTRGRTPSMV